MAETEGLFPDEGLARRCRVGPWECVCGLAKFQTREVAFELSEMLGYKPSDHSWIPESWLSQPFQPGFTLGYETVRAADGLAVTLRYFTTRAWQPRLGGPLPAPASAASPGSTGRCRGRASQHLVLIRRRQPTAIALPGRGPAR